MLSELRRGPSDPKAPGEGIGNTPASPGAALPDHGSATQFRLKVPLAAGCCCTFAVEAALSACGGHPPHTFSTPALTMLLNTVAEDHLALPQMRSTRLTNVPELLRITDAHSLGVTTMWEGIAQHRTFLCEGIGQAGVGCKNAAVFRFGNYCFASYKPLPATVTFVDSQANVHCFALNL